MFTFGVSGSSQRKILHFSGISKKKKMQSTNEKHHINPKKMTVYKITGLYFSRMTRSKKRNAEELFLITGD